MFNLPNEIQLKIYEYDSTYRDIFQIVLFDLMPVASVNRMNHVWKIWNASERARHGSRSSLSMMSYLINETVPDSDLIVSNLSRCNCCYKHSNRRPLHLYDRTWIDFGLSNPIEFCDYNTKCTCICRHSSRWLCRTFNQYFQ